MNRRQRIPPTGIDFNWQCFLSALRGAMAHQRRIVLAIRAARRSMR